MDPAITLWLAPHFLPTFSGRYAQFLAINIIALRGGNYEGIDVYVLLCLMIESHLGNHWVSNNACQQPRSSHK